MRKAFTLVECLISLAITAMLMAAVAAAFKASAVNYGENEEMFWTINNARQAMARMTTQLRTGYSVDPTADTNEVSFFTADDEDITYDFESAEQKLYLVKNGTAPLQRYALCSNVVAANFIKTPTNDGLDCKSVQISLTVRSGDTRRTLSSAAVIRRNLGQ
jgi:prepilin-type N-terminal cleavage/methylation domain-containing protein